MGLILKAFKSFFVIVFGALYLPLNYVMMPLSKEYQKLKYHKPWPFDFYLICVLMFPLWLITSIVSVPYELLVKNTH